MCCPALNALMESRGGSGAERGSVQEGNKALRSAVEETTEVCMKSRALLLQYEELSRNPHSLVFKGSQDRKMLFPGAWEMCWTTWAFLIRVVKIRWQFNHFWHFKIKRLSCRVSRRWCRPCGNAVPLQLFSTSRWRKKAQVPTQQRWAWGLDPANTCLAPVWHCPENSHSQGRELMAARAVSWRPEGQLKGMLQQVLVTVVQGVAALLCSANRLPPAGTALQGLLTSSRGALQGAGSSLPGKLCREMYYSFQLLH